jgi:hypothetical protein
MKLLGDSQKYMTKSVIFDTNALPVQRGLDGPLWLSVRKLCEMHIIDIRVPSVVVEESINLRRENYEVAEKLLLRALSKTAKFYDMDSVYVPSTEEIGDQWESELREFVNVEDIHGDDAVEALYREATRKRPAKNGRGARDSAIWLTVARRARIDEAVLFVSNNYKDFADESHENLHGDLLHDLDGMAGEVKYLRSVQDLIRELATTVALPDLNNESISAVLREEIDEQVGALPEVLERFDTDLYVASTQVEELKANKAYSVGDKVLVLLNGKGISTIQSRGEDSDWSVSFGGLVEVDQISGEVLSGEVHRVTASPSMGAIGT